MRVVIATGNRGKVAEIRAILADGGLAAVGLEACGPVDFPDEGDDYEANAVAKARAAAETLGEWAVADDSGLEVDALGGAPGPRSARYGGPGLDDRARVAHLLEALAGVPAGERRARFVCVAAAASPDGRVLTARGECAGRILEAPRGQGGFGYDPVFLPDEGQAGGPAPLAMAELPPETKDAISHRGRAFRALGEQLRAAARA